MKIIKTKFKNLNIIINKKFKDNRGFFLELFKSKSLNKKLPFFCVSSSKKNVVRGLHLQRKKAQAKYISVLEGRILDVVVDLRKGSKTFGKHFKIVLSKKNSKSLYIPAGFAHGFCGLDKENIVIYGCSNYRDKNSEIGLQWNDKDLKITWPINRPLLSKKDKNNLSFLDYKKRFN